MRVIDPGHQYALKRLDPDKRFEGIGFDVLSFVKREGPGYPGNKGSYRGTNMQEVLRALIARVQYLDNQKKHTANYYVLDDLRSALRKLEMCAAEQHGRPYPEFIQEVETMLVCPLCGHIGCESTCKDHHA